MDNYIVSARKYRPSTFNSVVGQKALTVTLKNAILNHKLAHAYLFCGPRGVGKTSCARIFAKTINCLDLTPEGEACNQCESCVAFNEQRSYNIHELDAASNNSVDDIRIINDQVRIPPQIGQYKVYIIDEVHMLSAAAFNAFLKTLEEPPHHAIFILATTEKHKILPTILSRCQSYDFTRISITDIVNHLAYVAQQENIHAEPEALNVIAQKVDGGMRDALSVFDQVASYTQGNITYQAVIDNLNVLDYDCYFKLTDAILKGDVPSTLLLFKDVIDRGFDGQSLIAGLASHFRDLLVAKDPQTLVLLETIDSIKERYNVLARLCNTAFLYKAIEIANDCDLNYRLSKNKRLLVELALIKLCQLLSAPPAPEQGKPLQAVNGQQMQQQAAPAAPQQQAPTPQAQAPTQQAAAAQPQSRVMTINPPAPTVSQEPPQRPAYNKMPSRGIPGVSIKNMTQKKQESEAKTTSQVATIEMRNPFTADDLTKQWDAFQETLDKDRIYLKNLLINCKPILLHDETFEVAVHNPGQESELTNGSLDLLTYLRTNLKNTHIKMQIRITEGNEKQLAYTSSEKYNLMVADNASLARFREEFGLIFD